MRIRFLIFTIYVFLCFVSVSAEYLDADLMQYFYTQGFLSKTAYLYENKTDYNDLERAAILNEILNRISRSKQAYDIPDNVLIKVQNAMNSSIDDLKIVSDVNISKINDKINSILASRDSYQKSSVIDSRDYTDGIRAEELLRRSDKNSSEKYYIIDPDSGPHIAYYKKRKEFFDKTPEKEKSLNKSYFTLAAGFYQPTSTSFAYVDNSTFTMFGAGFNKNSRLSYDFRKTYYKSEGTGNEFGVAGSSYTFELDIISAAIKLNIGGFKKFSTYAGYGISKVLMEHTLAEPGYAVSNVSEDFFAPYFFYGVDFVENNDFRAFIDVSSIITDVRQLNIKSKLYNVDSQNYIWSFGVKFYFKDI